MNTLWQLIEWRAAESPNGLFAVDEQGSQLSFAEYKVASESVAAGLPLGTDGGGVVSWMLPTRIDSLILMGALARLGATQNPILPAYRHRELGFVVRQLDPRLLIVPAHHRGFDYASMAKEVAGRAEVLVLSSLPSGDPSSLPRRGADPGRWTFYTSGTTADPKGVKHSDETLMAVARGLQRSLALGASHRHALVFPVSHVGGALFLMANLIGGSAQIVVEQFDVKTTPEVLRRHGVTHAGAGTVFHQAYLAAQRKTREPLFSRIVAFPGGGAPKPPQLHYDLRKELGAPIISGYGLTECPAVTMHRLDAPDELLAHTEGGANPEGAEVRIVRSDGSDAQAGEEGEIRVRGPQLFLGYVDAALDRAAFDERKFFCTGDLGRLDSSGYLTVTGRLKDIIIRKGENISAKEVEDLLYTHPNVAEVAVIGLPDEKLGERCCAVVACKSGTLTLPEMVTFLRHAGLMNQKIPEQLELVSQLPRNASGKIEKRALRARLQS